MSPSHAQAARRRADRVAAVLSLLGGEPASVVSAQSGVSRSTLYKWRRRAIDAMETALADRPYGPKRPHNRLSADVEHQIALLCRRYPTWSTAKIRDRLEDHAPSLSTVQRVRKRLNLQRLPTRLPPRSTAKQLGRKIKKIARQAIEENPWLGPERIAWEICNKQRLSISPSTVKRMKRALSLQKNPPPPAPNWCFYERHHPHSLWHGDCMEKVFLADTGQRAYHLALQDDYSRGYVFCDLFRQMDPSAAITSLITAMRQWNVIPKAVIFDNGTPFRGRLISAFCRGLDIQLTYTAVRHPQTNGKLERAFRDDMREFYQHYETWDFETLRRDLPDYVHYRNHIRGHMALGGRPAITRLREYDVTSMPPIPDDLERYACYQMDAKRVDDEGCVRLFNKAIYLDAALAGRLVRCYETLYGIEIRGKGEQVYSLPDYRKWQKKYTVLNGKYLPSDLRFEPCHNPICLPLADLQ